MHRQACRKCKRIAKYVNIQSQVLDCREYKGMYSTAKMADYVNFQPECGEYKGMYSAARTADYVNFQLDCGEYKFIYLTARTADYVNSYMSFSQCKHCMAIYLTTNISHIIQPYKPISGLDPLQSNAQMSDNTNHFIIDLIQRHGSQTMMRCINNTSHHSERRVMAKITSLQNPIIKVIGIKQWHLHGNLIGPSTFLSGTSLRLSVLPPFLCSLHGHCRWPLACGFRCCRRRCVQLGISIFLRGLWSD